MNNAININELITSIFGGETPKTPIPQPEDFNPWIDLKARKLFVNDDITNMTVDYVGYYIQRWNEEDEESSIPKEDRKPIRVYINTDGGDVVATLYICDLIKLSKTPVWTIGQGSAYSGGGLILASGHRRIAQPHTTILIHRGSFGAGGNANSAYDTVEFYGELDRKIEQYFVTNTKITEKKFKENKRREWFIFAEEALELGIIDEIATEII